VQFSTFDLRRKLRASIPTASGSARMYSARSAADSGCTAWRRARSEGDTATYEGSRSCQRGPLSFEVECDPESASTADSRRNAHPHSKSRTITDGRSCGTRRRNRSTRGREGRRLGERRPASTDARHERGAEERGLQRKWVRGVAGDVDQRLGAVRTNSRCEPFSVRSPTDQKAPRVLLRAPFQYRSSCSCY
jgi:hypothetical protein